MPKSGNFGINSPYAVCPHPKSFRSASWRKTLQHTNHTFPLALRGFLVRLLISHRSQRLHISPLSLSAIHYPQVDYLCALEALRLGFQSPLKEGCQTTILFPQPASSRLFPISQGSSSPWRRLRHLRRFSAQSSWRHNECFALY
jgi:hypothetical protein